MGSITVRRHKSKARVRIRETHPPERKFLASELQLFPDRSRETAPLAHRMRPARLEDFRGQAHLLGEGKPLGEAIRRGQVDSMVFWGPPGCGKTTLALLIARTTDRHFTSFSAVTEGVPRVREIIAEAEARARSEGRGTILFCDEIHRFNKAQQDAFLPHVERGTVTLIGATTENPSFELNNALLSRLRVFVLEPIPVSELALIVDAGLAELNRSGRGGPMFSAAAVELIARAADGDARRALNTTEALWNHFATRKARDGAPEISADEAAAALERRLARFDKSGEEHFNQISALHKAVRGSDVEGALYWLARMLAGGEDPLYLLRRLIRMAAEDIGLADPRALSVALAANETWRLLGSPEGELAIAEATIYLATAPKSNRVYAAWQAARDAASAHPALPVPAHIRNAPTRLMKDLGYGAGYRYDHDEGGFAAGQRYLPEELGQPRWYEPTESGFEKTLAERLAWWSRQRQAAGHE
jgi:putative ATPase